MSGQDGHTGQLGFDALLATAAADNRKREVARETAHLPAAMDEAISFYRALIERHHAAMLAADVDTVMALRKEAHNLALRLNGGAAGILAGPDSPGHVLARECAAAPGTEPLWGQDGDFTIDAAGMAVRIEMHGLLGLCSRFMYWPGFAARAVDRDKRFLSATGYRSFLGVHAEPEAGLPPVAFAAKVITAYVDQELHGRLFAVTAVASCG